MNPGGDARLAWRLCRRPYADLTGDGARLYGGRWNGPGRPVVYLASSAALCVLEVRVHLDLPFSLTPDDYVLMTVDLGNLPIEQVADHIADTVVVGNEWLMDCQTPVLEVPSTIVAESVNLLLNPVHSMAAQARVQSIRPFSFDERLWHDS